MEDILIVNIILGLIYFFTMRHLAITYPAQENPITPKACRVAGIILFVIAGLFSLLYLLMILAGNLVFVYTMGVCITFSLLGWGVYFFRFKKSDSSIFAKIIKIITYFIFWFSYAPGSIIGWLVGKDDDFAFFLGVFIIGVIVFGARTNAIISRTKNRSYPLRKKETPKEDEEFEKPIINKEKRTVSIKNNENNDVIQSIKQNKLFLFIFGIGLLLITVLNINFDNGHTHLDWHGQLSDFTFVHSIDKDAGYFDGDNDFIHTGYYDLDGTYVKPGYVVLDGNRNLFNRYWYGDLYYTIDNKYKILTFVICLYALICVILFISIFYRKVKINIVLNRHSKFIFILNCIYIISINIGIIAYELSNPFYYVDHSLVPGVDPTESGLNECFRFYDLYAFIFWIQSIFILRFSLRKMFEPYSEYFLIPNWIKNTFKKYSLNTVTNYRLILLFVAWPTFYLALIPILQVVTGLYSTIAALLLLMILGILFLFSWIREGAGIKVD